MKSYFRLFILIYGSLVPGVSNAQNTLLEVDYPAAINFVNITDGGSLTQSVSVPLSDSVTVSSVGELALIAKSSNRNVKMLPGTYQMEDYLTPEQIALAKPDANGRKAMIEFSGSGNVFDFSEVIIEVNTELLNDFKSYIIEFYITGNNNSIKGLTITDIGNEPTSSGGNSFTVAGDNNKIQNINLNVNGSYPYGYGDLLGKGSPNLVSLKKHSGMLIEGVNDSIIDCTVDSRAFGHLFFVQGGRNVYFENCLARAYTRSTTDMLAETSGPAYNLDFACVYNNRDGEKKIVPGYTKSLSECGFRTYGAGGVTGRTTGAVTAVNCKAIDCRVGFAFTQTDGDITIDNCQATGCEAGYNITGVTITNSKGDVKNGPLLYIDSGQVSNVELTLMPDTSSTIIHSIACIVGSHHNITLLKDGNNVRPQSHSILLGNSRPAGSNPFSPFGTVSTTNVTLNNTTEMPIELNNQTSNCTIITNGEVIVNQGVNNSITIKE